MNPQGQVAGLPQAIANYSTSPSVAQNLGVLGQPQLSGNMPGFDPQMFNTTQPSPHVQQMVKALQGQQ